MSGAERVVGINRLEPIEGRIQNGKTSLNNRTVAEHVNVAGMDNVTLVYGIAEGARFRAGAVTRHTLAIVSLK